MVKTKVQDLASELGVASEQLMTLLKEMHVFARGPQSSLEDDQVAALRVRWEREKRKQKSDAPAAKPKRRSAKAAAAAEAAPAAAESTAKPSKRRRTAAEVAEVEAQLEAERQAEAAATAAFELERPTLEKLELPEPSGLPMPTIEERARALFRDLPPLPAEAEPEAEPEVEAVPETPVRAERVTPPPAQAPAPSGPSVVHRAPPISGYMRPSSTLRQGQQPSPNRSSLQR